MAGSRPSPASTRSFGLPPNHSSATTSRTWRCVWLTREGKSPREIAAHVIAKLEVADLCEPPEIAGPGFINFRLRTDVLAQAVTDQLADPYVGVPQTSDPQVVVIDYSAPNVAKQMHVGHLRSTIIGDCLRRVIIGLGHDVIAQNHIGDWGTQFGMLVEQILDERLDRCARPPQCGGAVPTGQRAFPGRSRVRRSGAATGRVVADR